MTRISGNTTIKDIARMCGVSRGTVERVLTGRGMVRHDVEKLVLDTIKESRYSKKRANVSTRVITSKPVIGVIIFDGGNSFSDDVLSGIRHAESELAHYSVTAEIINMRGYDVQKQIEAIDGLIPRISVLVLQAINDPRISQRIFDLKKSGIPTITVNTDIENSDRILYVGSDCFSSGEMAAGLLNMITGGKGKLGIITGVNNLLGHVHRLYGFEKRLAERCPDIQTVARASAMDDDEFSYKATRAMLWEHPEIDCLQVIAAGTYGVCKAIIDSKKEKKIFVSAFDNDPKTVEMVKIGIVQAIVSQQPVDQGYLAFNAAFDTIISGDKSQRDNIIVENQIKILENLKP